MQAGEKEDVGEGSISERADASWSNQELSHYLVCVVEGDAAAVSAQQGSQGTQTDVSLGVVAVEISTGEVLYAQFRQADPFHLLSKQLCDIQLQTVAWLQVVLLCLETSLAQTFVWQT